LRNAAFVALKEWALCEFEGAELSNVTAPANFLPLTPEREVEQAEALVATAEASFEIDGRRYTPDEFHRAYQMRLEDAGKNAEPS
jgi:hypothetical protein